MTPPRTPRLAPALARWLIRGRDAEFVVGDLIERWEERRAVAPRRATCLLWFEILETGAARLLAHSRHVGGGRVPWIGTSQVSGIARDLRHVWRGLVRSPGFTALTTATLALGLGAVTAIFSVVYGVVFQPLPYPDPDRLVVVGATFPNPPRTQTRVRLASASIANFAEWREQATSFESLGGSWPSTATVTGLGDSERLAIAKITRGLFETLRVGSFAGRLFTDADHRAGAAPVAVLSHDFWQRGWAESRSAIGSSILVAGEPVQIVGVLPSSFVPPEALALTDTDIWLALGDDDAYVPFRDARVIDGIGRLGAGVELDAASTELAALAARQADEHPDTNRSTSGALGAAATPLVDETLGDVRGMLFLLLGAVILLLLIVCTNVANLFLARVVDRESEFAVRRALGASRVRVCWLLVAEALAVSVVGAAAGLLLASVGVGAFVRYSPVALPRLGEVALSPAVYGFAALTAALVAVACAAVPAWRAGLAPPGATMGSGARGTSAPPATRYRASLVVSETALAVVLLVGAGLMFHSFIRVVAVDLGIDPTNVQHVRVRLDTDVFDLGPATYFDAALEQLRALPGVDSAGLIENAPPGRASWRPELQFDGDTVADAEIGANSHVVSEAFFETLRIPIAAGRDFTASDRAGSAPVMIVNQTFASLYFGDESALGRRVLLGNPPGESFRTIVGVVDNIRQTGPRADFMPTIYMPFRQVGWPVMSMLVRARAAGGPVTGIREALLALDPAVPVPVVEPLVARIDSSALGERSLVTLLGLFAGIAAALAAVGIYGTTSHVMGRHRREIGIRIALGASRRRITAGAVAQGGRLVASGILIGGSVAWWLLRLAAEPLEPFLFGVRLVDPTTFVGVAGGLGLIGLLACYVPARRAAAVEPVQALRDGSG